MTYRLGKEDTMEGVLPTIKKHDAFLVGGILMRTIAFWGRGSQRAWEKATFPCPRAPTLSGFLASQIIIPKRWLKPFWSDFGVLAGSENHT